jgi:hypothetical protein
MFIREVSAFVRWSKVELVRPVAMCDNKSAIALAKQSFNCGRRTRHMDVRLNFVKQASKEGYIRVKYVESKLNRADPLTKPQTSKEQYRTQITQEQYSSMMRLSGKIVQ